MKRALLLVGLLVGIVALVLFWFIGYLVLDGITPMKPGRTILASRLGSHVLAQFSCRPDGLYEEEIGKTGRGPVHHGSFLIAHKNNEFVIFLCE